MNDPRPSAENDADTSSTVVFGGPYNPPGDAATLRAAHDAMMADHVEGVDSDDPQWEFWIRLAVHMSDLASAYESQVADDPSSAVYYDQEMHVALGYLRMTGRVAPPEEGKP